MFFTNDDGIITHYFSETSYIEVALMPSENLFFLIDDWEICGRPVPMETVLKTIHYVLGERSSDETVETINVCFNQHGEWFCSNSTVKGYNAIDCKHDSTDEEINTAVYRALTCNPQTKYLFGDGANADGQPIAVNFARRGKVKPPPVIHFTSPY